MIFPDLFLENVLLLHCGSGMQLQDLHLVTWSDAVVTSVAIIKHGHSALGGDAPPEHNMTMLACGTSNPSVTTFMIEDAVLHILNLLQQRLGVFSEALEDMQQRMGRQRWVYQPAQATTRRGYTMPVPYVSGGDKD